jgi:uncharacterized repeat protein (TIGR03803 family)
MTIAPLRRYVLSGMAAAMLAGCGSSLLRQPGVAQGDVAPRKATTAQQTRRNLKYAVLYNFKGGASDGEYPLAGLISLKGTLYGTTAGGGDGCDNGEGCGTVFSLTPSGTETILHNFGGSKDGAEPYATLINVNGTLSGTTVSGGDKTNDGTVFSITKSGTEAVVYRFKGYTGAALSDGLGRRLRPLQLEHKLRRPGRIG